jgi:DNA-binding NtrC family response regulator
MRTAQQRILCIDNRASRNLAVYLLERAGYEVRTTNSIADAIKLVLGGCFDLHLLNHKLVDGSEIDSCDKLHESAPRTPILFYSTVLYPYHQIRAIHCRLHGHVVEPVNVCEVVEYAFRLIEKQVRPVDGTSHHLTEIKRKEFSVGSKVLA